MPAIPFALSVHHFVTSVGADAGFAAIIGLAILVLLFFSQARETSTLRKRAAESEEHVQQLELRVAQLSRGVAAGTAAAVAQAPAAAQPRPGVMPAPASVRGVAAAAPAASRAVAVSEVPAAPAGVGAPSLSAATRMIPSGDEGAISIRSADAATADREVPVQAAVAGVAAGVAAGMTAAHGDGSQAGSSGGTLAPPGPPPATAAGANGSSGGRVAPPPMPAPAPPPAAARSAQQPPRGPARPSGSGPRRPPSPPHKRSGLATAGMVAAGLLVVAAIVVVLLVVTSNSASNSSSSSSSAINNASATGRHHRGAAVKPANVNVVVLNGTPTPNLAHDITQRLAGVGYQTGAPATATDQNQSATVVGYVHGHKDGALLVAKSLKLGSASVQPVSQSSEAVACPQASTCKAQVVVTVGADLASSATSTSTSTT